MVLQILLQGSWELWGGGVQRCGRWELWEGEECRGVGDGRGKECRGVGGRALQQLLFASCGTELLDPCAPSLSYIPSQNSTT